MNVDNEAINLVASRFVWNCAKYCYERWMGVKDFHYSNAYYEAAITLHKLAKSLDMNIFTER